MSLHDFNLHDARTRQIEWQFMEDIILWIRLILFEGLVFEIDHFIGVCNPQIRRWLHIEP